MICGTEGKENLGLYPPVFQEHSVQNKEAVLVRISNEAKLSEWELVKDYLSNHDAISNKELRTIINLSDKESHKASRLFAGWVDSGLIRIMNPEEGTRNRKYGLANSAQALLAGKLAINGGGSLIFLLGKGVWNAFLAMEEAKEKEVAKK